MNIPSLNSEYRWLSILFISFLFITTGYLSLKIFAEENNIIQSKKYYEKGVNLLNNGNIIAAIQEIEKAISTYPDNQFAHFKLGIIYLEKTKAKFYSKAPEHFKAVIDLVKDPNDSYYIDSYYYLGLSYLQLGQYDEAINAFKEVLSLDSNYPEAIKIHNYLGVAYYYKDNYEQAIPEFKAALQMDAHFKLSNFNLKSVNMRLEHYNIGITYFFMKNYDEAIKEFSIAIEIDTNYFAAHMMIGETYLKKGIYNEAIREFQRAMMINPTHRDIPKILNKMGTVYYLQEKYKEAVFSLRKALELDPENSEAIINLRHVFENFRPDLSKYDIDKHKEKYISSHLELANDYFLIGMYQDALREYQLVFEADSQNTEVYKKLKITYRKLINFYLENKQYDNAIGVLKKIILIEPENETYWFWIGKAYYLKGKFWAKEAIEALKKAPTVKNSYYYLGKAYLDQGNTKESINAFERAIEKDDKNSLIPNELGNIFYKQSDCEKAVEWYKKACEIDPNNKDYQRNLERAYRCLEARTPKPGGEQTVAEDTPISLNNEAIKAGRESYWDSAQDFIEKAIKMKPDSGILYNNMGIINFSKNITDEALANFLMADSLDPNNAEVQINMAICFFKLKDFESAEKGYDKAIKLNKKYLEKYKWLTNKNSNENESKIEFIWLELK